MFLAFIVFLILSYFFIITCFLLPLIPHPCDFATANHF